MLSSKRKWNTDNATGIITKTPKLSKDATEEKAEWWRIGPVYQIYPKSFRDERGTGVGNLKGKK